MSNSYLFSACPNPEPYRITPISTLPPPSSIHPHMLHTLRMFNNPGYIPPSPTSPASLIAPLDAYIMADLIQGTLTETDPAIAAEIAEHIILHNISGEDFLYLSETYLRGLSKDNHQVFKELRELQNTRISSSTLILSSIFPEPSSLIHNFRLSHILEGLSGGINNMGNAAAMSHHTDDSVPSAQFPEDFNDESWDFSDEDDLRTPDLYATVTEAAQAAPQDDITLGNLHLTVSVNPAQENGPTASGQAIPQAVAHAHTATIPTSDGTATQAPSAEEAHNSELQSTPSVLMNADDASIYGINESQLINSLDSQSVGRLDGESVLGSPVFSTPSTRSSSPLSYLSYVDSDDEDPDAATPGQHSQIHPDNSVPIPHTTMDLNIPIEHGTPQVISRPSTPSPGHPTQVFLDVSQLESLLSRTLDYPQTTMDSDPDILIEHDRPPIISIPSSLACLPASDSASETMIQSWQILITEDEETFEPPCGLPASEPAATSDSHHDFDINEALNGRTYEAPQSYYSSREEPEDAIHEVDSPGCSNTGSMMDRCESFASNETHESIESCQSSPPSSSTLSLDSSHNIDESNEQNKLNVDTASFTLPIDIIPVTPLNSPVFEGLSQYMIVGAVVGVDQDDVSTPVHHDIAIGEPERTLLPSSETHGFGIPSSIGNGQSLRNEQQLEPTDPPESPGLNADIAIALASDPPYPHFSYGQVRVSHLGRSTSPLEYMQSGILRLLPTMFALRRETIDRAT